MTAQHPTRQKLGEWLTAAGSTGIHGRQRQNNKTQLRLSHAKPHSRVALEPRAESDLQHSVATLDVSVVLDVLELVPVAHTAVREGHAEGTKHRWHSPNGGAARVAVVAQSGLRWLCVVWLQRKVLLDAINHGTATRVDAEVLDALLEVGDVCTPCREALHGLPFGEGGLCDLLQASQRQRRYHLHLLANGEDAGAAIQNTGEMHAIHKGGEWTHPRMVRFLVRA